MARVRNGVPTPLAGKRLAGRAVKTARAKTSTVKRTIASAGFPYRAPTKPRGVVVPEEETTLGANFETEWARSLPARAARKVIVAGPMRLGVKLIADPEVVGTDRLEDLRQRDDVPAVIFAPNHHSHVDTPLIITVVPEPWRSKLFIAAAADFFFDKRVKGTASALVLNALPIDREVTGRKNSDQIRKLIDEGWSLVIYPEGGRSPDGWGQEFKGGAAYLSARTGAAVVPVFIDGSGAIFGKGMKRLKPGRTKVVFGSPMWPTEGESTRRFNSRIEAAVVALGDEALTDWWSARQRTAKRENPSLGGPEYTGWRRQWALAEQRKLGKAGQRKRQKRRWPDLG